jgi:hypothetical protein
VNRVCTQPGLADEADWNIVKKGYYAHVLGEAPNTFKDAHTAVKTLRVGVAWSKCLHCCTRDRHASPAQTKVPEGG